jgi:hypothetical protein
VLVKTGKIPIPGIMPSPYQYVFIRSFGFAKAAFLADEYIKEISSCMA